MALYKFNNKEYDYDLFKSEADYGLADYLYNLKDGDSQYLVISDAYNDMILGISSGEIIWDGTEFLDRTGRRSNKLPGYGLAANHIYRTMARQSPYIDPNKVLPSDPQALQKALSKAILGGAALSDFYATDKNDDGTYGTQHRLDVINNAIDTLPDKYNDFFTNYNDDDKAELPKNTELLKKALIDGKISSDEVFELNKKWAGLGTWLQSLLKTDFSDNTNNTGGTPAGGGIVQPADKETQKKQAVEAAKLKFADYFNAKYKTSGVAKNLTVANMEFTGKNYRPETLLKWQKWANGISQEGLEALTLNVARSILNGNLQSLSKVVRATNNPFGNAQFYTDDKNFPLLIHLLSLRRKRFLSYDSREPYTIIIGIDKKDGMLYIYNQKTGALSRVDPKSSPQLKTKALAEYKLSVAVQKFGGILKMGKGDVAPKLVVWPTMTDELFEQNLDKFFLDPENVVRLLHQYSDDNTPTGIIIRTLKATDETAPGNGAYDITPGGKHLLNTKYYQLHLLRLKTDPAYRKAFFEGYKQFLDKYPKLYPETDGKYDDAKALLLLEQASNITNDNNNGVGHDTLLLTTYYDPETNTLSNVLPEGYEQYDSKVSDDNRFRYLAIRKKTAASLTDEEEKKKKEEESKIFLENGKPREVKSSDLMSEVGPSFMFSASRLPLHILGNLRNRDLLHKQKIALVKVNDKDMPVSGRYNLLTLGRLLGAELTGMIRSQSTTDQLHNVANLIKGTELNRKMMLERENADDERKFLTQQLDGELRRKSNDEHTQAGNLNTKTEIDKQNQDIQIDAKARQLNTASINEILKENAANMLKAITTRNEELRAVVEHAIATNWLNLLNTRTEGIKRKMNEYVIKTGKSVTTMPDYYKYSRFLDAANQFALDKQIEESSRLKGIRYRVPNSYRTWEELERMFNV